MAEQVMRMASAEPEPTAAARTTTPALQRQASDDGPELSTLYGGEEEEEEQQVVQTAGAPGETPRARPDTASRISALRGGGAPLPHSARSFFEPRLGYDFGHVRVHTGAHAAETARGVRALAFTVGSDVVFGAGQYDPDSDRGRSLLAHELVHVIQQRGGRAAARHAAAADLSRAPDDATPFIQREDDPAGDDAADDGGEAQAERALTRPEEVALSRTSPGEVTGTQRPPLISLFNFTIAVATPKERHVAAIAEVADMVSHAPPGLVKLIVVGHTDASGEPAVNDPLSRRRAEGVRQRLSGSLGGAPLEVTWRGENDPVTTEDTVTGRSRNRRVDLHFLPLRSFQPGGRVRPPAPGGGVPPPGTEPPITDTPPPTDDRPPPTDQPPPVTDQPPPIVEPPPPRTDDDDGSNFFCVDHPIICGALGLGAGLAAALALFGGLGGTLSGLLACVVNPAACLLGPELPPPGGPGGDRPPGDDGPPGGDRPPGGDEPPGGDKPPGDDGPPDDKKPPEEDDDRRPPRVSFGHVNAENTPAGMRDRIPPRVGTPVGVSVTNWRTGTPPIQIFVQGAGTELGTLTINGDVTVEITDSTVLDLVGVLQSKPGGRGGALRLEATQGGAHLASSNFFAVAAIPQDLRVVFDSPIKGDALGALTMNHWKSDSEEISDLDGIRLKEIVEEKKKEGVFAGKPPTEFQPREVNGTSSPRPDKHSTPASWLTDTGLQRNVQVFIFEDRRTGSFNIPIRNSSFELLREVSVDGERTPADPSVPCLKFVYTQRGQKDEADGFKSDAGETEPSPIVVPFNLPCVEAGHDPPKRVPPRPPRGGRTPPGGGAGGAGRGGRGGGGAGTTRVTVVRPRPIKGNFEPSNIALRFISGLPPKPVVDGEVHHVLASFQSQGRTFEVTLPYKVEAVTDERVFLRSQNAEDWDIAPEKEDIPPVVLRAHSPASLPLELLK